MEELYKKYIREYDAMYEMQELLVAEGDWTRYVELLLSDIVGMMKQEVKNPSTKNKNKEVSND
jgi:hypothetical protein